MLTRSWLCLQNLGKTTNYAKRFFFFQKPPSGFGKWFIKHCVYSCPPQLISTANGLTQKSEAQISNKSEWDYHKFDKHLLKHLNTLFWNRKSSYCEATVLTTAPRFWPILFKRKFGQVFFDMEYSYLRQKSRKYRFIMLYVKFLHFRFSRLTAKHHKHTGASPLGWKHTASWPVFLILFVATAPPLLISSLSALLFSAEAELSRIWHSFTVAQHRRQVAALR